MKNFKDLLSEVSQPKSAEERRFKDQHTIELIRHPVAPDSQFNGEIEGLVKEKRPADPDAGEDVAKYDVAYLEKDRGFKKPRKITETFDIEDIEDFEKMDEKAKSQAQQKLMALALSVKRGETDPDEVTPNVVAIAKGMSEKDLEDYAKTKTKDLPTKAKNESVSFKDLLERVMPVAEQEINLSESPREEISMMLRQLHFIAYAAEEIVEYLSIEGIDPREWWQNKLTTAFVHMQSLHSYIEGDKRVMDSAEDPIQNYETYPMAYEQAEFEAGDLVLENEEVVELSEEDAHTLSAVFESLEETNRKLMRDVMLENKESFQEVLEFAKEVLE